MNKLILLFLSLILCSCFINEGIVVEKYYYTNEVSWIEPNFLSIYKRRLRRDDVDSYHKEYCIPYTNGDKYYIKITNKNYNYWWIYKVNKSIYNNLSIGDYYIRIEVKNE